VKPKKPDKKPTHAIIVQWGDSRLELIGSRQIFAVITTVGGLFGLPFLMHLFH
jgi:hypothetical protein